MRVPMLLLALVLASVTSHGQITLPQMLSRLGREATAFQTVAPDLQAEETLEQSAFVLPSKFRLRAGESAKNTTPELKSRKIVSAYGFVSLGTERAIHEIRQVISVDGKTVTDAKSAQDLLARLATAPDGLAKDQSLKQLDKYALRGAVTDFGPLLLLFDSRSQERYEFTASLDPTGDIVIHYRQLDGSTSLTVVDGATGGTSALRVEGDIRFRRDDGSLASISMKASGRDHDQEYRQEATVEYAPSEFGAALPTRVEHREYLGGRAVVDNRFSYSGFRKFSKN
ncbi:MAG: hypothetical protein ABL995_18575 [Bryobacteraceae bacterium]